MSSLKGYTHVNICIPNSNCCLREALSPVERTRERPPDNKRTTSSTPARNRLPKASSGRMSFEIWFMTAFFPWDFISFPYFGLFDNRRMPFLQFAHHAPHQRLTLTLRPLFDITLRVVDFPISFRAWLLTVTFLLRHDVRLLRRCRTPIAEQLWRVTDRVCTLLGTGSLANSDSPHAIFRMSGCRHLAI